MRQHGLLRPNNMHFRLDVTVSAIGLALTAILSGAFNLDADTFRQRLGYDKPPKDHEVIIYCKKGKRSSIACDSAKKAGYTK